MAASRRYLGILLCLLALRASADVLVTVMDQDLGSPLEGVRISVQGLDRAFVTDERGEVTIPSPKDGERLLVTAQLLGYRTLKKALGPGQDRLALEMAVEGAIQGQELVVEGSKPQATDSQAGVSQVVTSQDIQTQTMGIIEDAISAIKILPGVGYTGVFSSKPSINGGDPNETVATLDGAYVLNPYQWAGAFTIFNPDMIDSIKLSSGITGAPYGQVMSGLLEVASKVPTDSYSHLDFGLSTTGLDLFYQAGLGDKAGILLGGKVTWMTVPLTLIGQGSLFTVAPYIRNGTADLYWNPTPTLNLTLNANLDSDGVASGSDNFVFHLYESQLLVSTGLKDLLSENLLWNLLLSYNSLNTSLGFVGPDRYDPSLVQHSSSSEDDYRYQARTSFDWTPTKGQVVSFGLDEMLENWSESVDGMTYPGDRANDFTPLITSSHLSGKNTLSSGLFVDDSFTIIPEVLSGEGGLRVDHSFVFGGGEQLQTFPVLNPRIRLTYTFLRDQGGIKSMDINGGTGLYSQFPADNHYLDTGNGVVSVELGPTRAWFTVLGLDIEGSQGETLNLMLYAKTYLNRFYTATTASATTVLKYDGLGYAYGLDLGLKKQTLFWDASLSNSLSMTQLYNPGDTGLVSTNWASPLGVWYFPSYQVAETLHVDLTLKPSDGFSILTQGTLASGTPTSTGGRTDWQYPIDVKLDWHGFYTASKLRWEFYFGCEDVFALLYFVRTNTAASFNIGYPIPSVGYKLSF